MYSCGITDLAQYSKYSEKQHFLLPENFAQVLNRLSLSVRILACTYHSSNIPSHTIPIELETGILLTEAQRYTKNNYQID